LSQLVPRPPALPAWLLRHWLPAELAEPLLGDLAESFVDLVQRRGVAAARRHYWRQALTLPLTLRRAASPAAMSRTLPADGPMTILSADLRYAVRQIRVRPGFGVLVVATLALGIGATTAIFSAVDPILFAPLPYPHPDQLLMISERNPNGTSNGIGYATIADIRDMAHSFDRIAAIAGWGPTLTGPTEPQLFTGENVSASYFSVLGVQPALGRDFLPDEDVQGAARVTILSHALWQSQFGGDSTLIGRTITLNDTPFTVVGVMPAGFDNIPGPQTQLWTTLRYNVTLPYACRTCHHVRAIGRLKPGVTAAQARVELDAISARLVADHPAEYVAPGMLAPTLASQVTSGVRPTLIAILGAAVLLLLIATANATNLLLARSAQRQGEFAVRAALGAAQHRIVRQLLTESMLLALAAGTLGIGIAVVGVRALVALAPPRLPMRDAIHVNLAALLFTLLVTTAIGIGFGLLPALHATRGELYHGIKRTSRRGAGTRHLTSGALVVSEVALALTLLIGSGLLLRTVTRLLSEAPGFDASHLLTLQVQTNGKRFADSAVTLGYFDDVLARVRATPGVRSAALTSQLPLSGDFDGNGVHQESHPNPHPETDPSAFRYAVSPGYLETMHIPLLHGRTLAATDGAAQPPVVVINATFAAQLWPQGDAVGQRIRLGAADNGPWFSIVGIVGDVRHVSLAADAPAAVYLPEAQWRYTDGAMTLVVRTAGDPSALAPAVRQAVRSVDRNQPIVRVSSMEQLIIATEAQRRFALMLLTVFSTVALVLAAAGIYGVLSGSVTERLAELGVRSALGASRPDLLWLVGRQGGTFVGLGIAIGLAGGAALSGLLQSLLVGVPRVDLFTYTAVTLLLLAVSAVVTAVPAWRAAAVDPAMVLRE
jgi:putative ABC transport system permease protein